VALGAEHLHGGVLERQPRKNGDAVISLLAVECRMHVTEPREAFERKFLVRTFGFLKAEHVRPKCPEESSDLIDAQPHRVDVPGRDGNLHEKLERSSTCAGRLR